MTERVFCATAEILLMLGFIMFAAAAFFTKVNFGNVTGAVCCTVAFFALFYREKLAALITSLWGNRIWRAALTAAAVFVVICVLLAAFISVMMIKAAYRKPDIAQNVIILGCRVKDSGASLMLTKRIDAAYEYLSENPDTICIASGGQGIDEPMSEAECIKQALVSKGILAERVYIEDKSTNTYENLKFSGQLLDSLGYDRTAVIVTSEFHQLRASMIAQKQGYEAYSVSSPTYLPLLPSYWIREWYAVIYEFIT